MRHNLHLEHTIPWVLTIIYTHETTTRIMKTFISIKPKSFLVPLCSSSTITCLVTDFFEFILFALAELPESVNSPFQQMKTFFLLLLQMCFLPHSLSFRESKLLTDILKLSHKFLRFFLFVCFVSIFFSSLYWIISIAQPSYSLTPLSALFCY